ncbi:MULTISPECIES: hypothetical protein [unclassified Beijerinckia]|uniref:hypothetical protein n=1 Tax=unclassified Beijerinckia TaxID=2638183 RepID=UPI000897A752|nr:MULTISPECIES: hypothetical protein [unclassified Beijerinckia]MDH7794324.1 hypothetical protein [Beijerinckia sp. GAS462]SEB58861.1 hypothetical protein SAMN05443249_0593 [Beijerinckia sp. 28-YEA-48]
MLLSVCGTLSPISIATRRLVSIIAEETIGVPEHIHAVEVGQLRDAWKNIPQEKRTSMLLYSDAPQASMIKLLIDSDIPIVLSNDNFEEIFAFDMLNGSKEFMIALRLATYTVVQWSQLIHARNFFIGPDRYDAPITELAEEIMRFFNIRQDAQQWERLQTRLGNDKSKTLRDFIAAEFPQWQSTAGFIETLSDEDRLALESVAKGYDPLTKRHPMEAVNWTRRCFQDGDASDRQLTGPKTLNGPARILFFGPHAHLPPGRWDCEIQIELNDCRTDTMAMVDVFDGEILGAVSLRLPRRGTYAIDVSFEVTRTHAPLEFRMQLLKGAIEGELLLLGVKVKRAEARGARENLSLTHASH